MAWGTLIQWGYLFMQLAYFAGFLSDHLRDSVCFLVSLSFLVGWTQLICSVFLHMVINDRPMKTHPSSVTHPSAHLYRSWTLIVPNAWEVLQEPSQSHPPCSGHLLVPAAVCQAHEDKGLKLNLGMAGQQDVVASTFPEFLSASRIYF